MAPLSHIAGASDSSHPCETERDVVVTGWTSGILTAHDFATGDEMWNVSTSAPDWGITGGGFLATTGEIVWPTETGIIQVCAANGTILHQHHDSGLRTYRANLGAWVDMEAMSDPASGSVMAKQPMRDALTRSGIQRRFCSSEPNRLSVAEGANWVLMCHRTALCTRAICSVRSTIPIYPSPVPP